MKRRSFLTIMGAAALFPFELLKPPVPQGLVMEFVPLYDVYPNSLSFAKTVTMKDLEKACGEVKRYGPRHRYTLCSPRFMEKVHSLTWDSAL